MKLDSVLARAGWHGVCSTPKPPRLFIPPKPRWLPVRKRMTIALGILASDGIVVASDTQETYSDLRKVRQTKILAVVNEPNAGLLVTGAGSGPQIDALSQILCDRFSRETPSSLTALDGALQNQVQEFQV